MEIKKIASNSLNFIIKSIVQMAGLFILLIGLFLLTSLLSYSPEDPNFIFPKNTEIQNILGFKGSVVADLFFQSLGLISMLVAINLLFTGINIIKSKKAILIIENFFYVILYSLLGALFFTTYYSNSFWLSINGNGGFIGKYLESTFLGSLININHEISYYILIIIILLFFLISINFKLNSFLNSVKTLFKGEKLFGRTILLEEFHNTVDMTFIRFVNVTSKSTKYIGFQIKENKGLKIIFFLHIIYRLNI